MRGHPWRRQIDQLGLAQLLVASAAVFELVWWPCRCFSQAWAPKPNSSTVAIRVAVNRRCMAEKVFSDKPKRERLGNPPWIGGFGLDFVTIASHCCRLRCPRSTPNAAAAAISTLAPWAGWAIAVFGAPYSVPSGPFPASAPVGAPNRPRPGLERVQARFP